MGCVRLMVAGAVRLARDLEQGKRQKTLGRSRAAGGPTRGPDLKAYLTMWKVHADGKARGSSTAL